MMMGLMAPSVRHPVRPPLGDDEPQDQHPQGPGGPRPDGPGRPPQEGAGNGRPSDDQPELALKKLSPTGLVASGAAAATASVVGGQLGIAGTVIGAALTSVVSATALAAYTDSVNRSKAKLKSVAEKTHVAPSARPTLGKSTSRTAARAQGPREEPAGRESPGAEEDSAGVQPSSRRRITRTVILAVVIALIGVLAVFGIQRITGTELSPGTGEIQRSVTGNDSIAPRGNSSSTDQEQEDVDPQQQDRPPDQQENSDDTEQRQDQGPAENQGEAPGNEEPAPAEQGSGTGDGGGGGSTAGQGSGTSGE